MPDEPKLEAYFESARTYSKPPPTPADISAMKDRHEGCKEQFIEVSEKLKKAIAAKDDKAIKQHEDLLRDNFQLRKSLVTKLRAAGKPVADPMVE